MPPLSLPQPPPSLPLPPPPPPLPAPSLLPAPPPPQPLPPLTQAASRSAPALAQTAPESTLVPAQAAAEPILAQAPADCDMARLARALGTMREQQEAATAGPDPAFDESTDQLFERRALGRAATHWQRAYVRRWRSTAHTRAAAGLGVWRALQRLRKLAGRRGASAERTRRAGLAWRRAARGCALRCWRAGAAAQAVSVRNFAHASAHSRSAARVTGLRRWWAVGAKLFLPAHLFVAAALLHALSLCLARWTRFSAARRLRSVVLAPADSRRALVREVALPPPPTPSGLELLSAAVADERRRRAALNRWRARLAPRPRAQPLLAPRWLVRRARCLLQRLREHCAAARLSVAGAHLCSRRQRVGALGRLARWGRRPIFPSAAVLAAESAVRAAAVALARWRRRVAAWRLRALPPDPARRPPRPTLVEALAGSARRRQSAQLARATLGAWSHAARAAERLRHAHVMLAAADALRGAERAEEAVRAASVDRARGIVAARTLGKELRGLEEAAEAAREQVTAAELVGRLAARAAAASLGGGRSGGVDADSDADSEEHAMHLRSAEGWRSLSPVRCGLSRTFDFAADFAAAAAPSVHGHVRLLRTPPTAPPAELARRAWTASRERQATSGASGVLFYATASPRATARLRRGESARGAVGEPAEVIPRSAFGSWRAAAAAAAARRAAEAAARTSLIALCAALAEAEADATAVARADGRCAQAEVEAVALLARVVALMRSRAAWAQTAGERRGAHRGALRVAVRAWRVGAAAQGMAAGRRERACSLALVGALADADAELDAAEARTRSMASGRLRAAAELLLVRRHAALSVDVARGAVAQAIAQGAMASGRAELARAAAKAAELAEAAEAARVDALSARRARDRALRSALGALSAQARAAAAEGCAAAERRANFAEVHAAAVERASELAARVRRRTLAFFALRAHATMAVCARLRASATTREARAAIWQASSWQKEAEYGGKECSKEAEAEAVADKASGGRATPQTAGPSRAGNRASRVGERATAQRDTTQLREEHLALSAHQFYVLTRLTERASHTLFSTPRR
ncbi:hypothetical protein T492DRAFT_861959 [Pavlovales sp. CCMP2436]|nr:hypothetical protein T492DRAFT_861959 [Pavlovales sp. CCMP2436]